MTRLAEPLGPRLAAASRPKPSAAAPMRHFERTWAETLAFVAHDLRNPLSAIRTAAELIDNRVGEEDVDARLRIDIIHRAVDRMGAMLDDLILLAHPSPREAQRRRPFSLAASLRDAAALYASTAAEAGVSLRLELAEVELRAYADAGSIARVVENLLCNALRHTPAGGEVRISAASRGAELEVEIADTGSGIAQRDLRRVFDRFWRGPAPRDGGAGLGLTISKQLVEANGGRISVRNLPRGGATFRFTIPAADPIP